MTAIVHSLEPITLIGGGPCLDDEIGQALTFAPRVVAADSGAARALAYKARPEAVIGDMDSIDAVTRSALPRTCIFQIDEQDSTDFDKALRHIEAPLVIGVGFSGGRLDHQLAALHALVHHADRPCILLGRQDVVFLAPPHITLNLPIGCRFSLFPMGPARGHAQGLQWPIAGLEFAPETKIGTSNIVTGPVSLSFEAPNMLVILPAFALGEVVMRLTSLVSLQSEQPFGPRSVRWSARAAPYKDPHPE